LNNQLPLIDIFELSETSKSYFAGLFDGEGTIALYPNNTKNSYVFGLAVGLTNPMAANMLLLAFGGTVDFKEYKNPKWRPLYTWRVYGKRAETVSRCLLPYLKLKREELEIALKIRNYNHRAGAGQRRKEIADAVTAIRHRRYQ